MPRVSHELTPFQKGIDFISHFKGKAFSLTDIKQRYGCTYRNAQYLFNLLDKVVKIEFAGFEKNPAGIGSAFTLHRIRM